MKNKNQKLSKKAGDFLERTGEKISRSGAKKIGKAVYNAGDKLEHSQDNRDKERGKRRK